MSIFHMGNEGKVGRPDPCTGRLEKEVACYDLLDRLSMTYTRVDHPPADTIAACQEVEKILGAEICKNLFLCNRQKTAFYLLVMKGDKAFHTKDLSKQIGSARLSFASPEDMERLLGVTPGSATILGLMHDSAHQVMLLLDRPVLELEKFGCHPCINTSSLALKMSEVCEILLPALGVQPIIVDLPAELEGDSTI